LVSLRWRANLGRGELAAAAGVSEHLIQSLEQGRTSNPKLKSVIGLARALGVTVGELVEGLSEAGDGPESGGNGVPLF
jgi:transcriptional regulator with XRE-family HTH domain